MGYYSDFDIEIRGLKGKDRKKFVKDLESICPDMMFNLEQDIVETYFNAKWYDCEDEIENISFK